MDEHVILVAFTIEADDRPTAESALTRALPNPSTTAGLEDWWIAEDDRRDGSDRDSAVFVTMGRQGKAYRYLSAQGLTPPWNLPGGGS